MTGILSTRWAAWSAIVFAVVFVAATLFLSGQVQSDMTASDYNDTYDNTGWTLFILITGVVAVLATALLGIFLVHLQDRLEKAAGAEASLARLARPAASILLGTWVVGNLAQANVAGAIVAGGYDVPSPEIAYFFSQFGIAIVLIGTLFAAAAIMGITAAIAFRSSAFPRWVAWCSALTAVISLFGALFFPALAFPIWLIAMGVHLLRSPAATPAKA